MTFWNRLFGAKSPTPPSKGTRCIVTCHLPREFARGKTQQELEPVVAKCAIFAGNLVVDKYDIDDAHREVTVVGNPSDPGVVFNFDVPAEKGIEVAEYTRQAWRELM